MSDRVFLDTNIFVYLNSVDDKEKKIVAKNALNSNDCIVSTQVINELSSVLLKKYGRSVAEVKTTISAIDKACIVSTVSRATIDIALDVHERYGYSYYDSLIIASALEANCKYVYSEDMQDGQTINGSLAIINIFKNATSSFHA